MKGKDWFVVGIRLLGAYLLYYGIYEALIQSLNTMFFANLERSSYLYYPQPSNWSRLFYGGVNIAIGLLALTRAGRFADWCYARDRKAPAYGAIDDVLPVRKKQSGSAKLTEEQKALLIRMGEPDDGTPLDLPANGERVLQELMDQGLVYSSGDGGYDLTDDGERLYERITGKFMG